MFRSAEYKAWTAEAHIAWLQQRLQLSVKSVKGWYSITILAHPPDKRQRDLGNLEKVVSDFLQTVGVIENDSLAGRIELEWDTVTVPINSIRVTVGRYLLG